MPACSRRRWANAKIVTPEGLQPDERAALTAVQQAFVEEGAVQCGFCTPGLVMAVHDLLARDAEPDDLAVREAVSGNLCRCTGYGRMLAARCTARSTSWAGCVVSVVTRTPPHEVGSGESATRPDAVPKVRGEFAFAGDLWAEGMLWGQTLRSPHPSARIIDVDVGPALAIPGVAAVLIASDMVGRNRYGLEHRDQPVFADEVVRYAGEPIAAVAADHPETARRACAAIVVRYDVLEPVTDPDAAPTRRRCTRTATSSASW